MGNLRESGRAVERAEPQKHTTLKFTSLLSNRGAEYCSLQARTGTCFLLARIEVCMTTKKTMHRFRAYRAIIFVSDIVRAVPSAGLDGPSSPQVWFSVSALLLAR